MIPFERRAIFSLALLYATRMLGLFMVLPVFIIYGQDLEGSSNFLLGVALGAYGLSQALFQVPFGALSDRFGRKKLIFAGLLLFFAGSVLAALSTDIYGVIAGRFLQGAGAIASVLMALLSDLTSEESRTKAMALVGMSIGISFSLALVLGPLVAQYFALQGIFWLTAGMALFAIGWLMFFVPNPVQSTKSRDTRLFKDQLAEVLANRELLRLDFGIFALHMCLTAMFIAVPMSLLEKAGVPIEDHWLIYLSVMVLSFFAMVPFIILGEKKQQMKPVFIFAVALLGCSAMLAIWSSSGFAAYWLTLFLFFMAFNLLEASLPSLVSKIAPAGSKGTAMGVYSTSQFMGAFVGGVAGGALLGAFGEAGVYAFVAVACATWVLVASTMARPNPETGMTLHFAAPYDSQKAQQLTTLLSEIKGVEEVVTVPGESLAYLKVVKRDLDLEGVDGVRLKLGL